MNDNSTQHPTSVREDVRVPRIVAENVTDGRALALWVHLALAADESGEAALSRADMARAMGLRSPNAIDRILNRLRSYGAIEIVPRWLGEDGEVVYSPAPGCARLANGIRLVEVSHA